MGKIMGEACLACVLVLFFYDHHLVDEEASSCKGNDSWIKLNLIGHQSALMGFTSESRRDAWKMQTRVHWVEIRKSRRNVFVSQTQILLRNIPPATCTPSEHCWPEEDIIVWGKSRSTVAKYWIYPKTCGDLKFLVSLRWEEPEGRERERELVNHVKEMYHKRQEAIYR